MKDNLRNIHRQALELVNQAHELGYVITIDTVPEQPLAMGNHTMVVNVRPARQLDPVTIAMIEDEAQALADQDHNDEDEDWSCSHCGGPMHRTQIGYHNQCGDCGRMERVEREAP